MKKTNTILLSITLAMVTFLTFDAYQVRQIRNNVAAAFAEVAEAQKELAVERRAEAQAEMDRQMAELEKLKRAAGGKR